MAVNEKKTAEVPAPVTPHAQFLQEVDPKIMAAMQAMEQLKGTNTISRAFKIQEKVVWVGKEKKDDNGNVVVGENGPEKWPDIFVLATSSEDGTVDVRVPKEQWDLLEVGSWYMAVGRVAIKTPYQGNSKEVIEYSDFQPLYGTTTEGK